MTGLEHERLELVTATVNCYTATARCRCGAEFARRADTLGLAKTIATRAIEGHLEFHKAEAKMLAELEAKRTALV